MRSESPRFTRSGATRRITPANPTARPAIRGSVIRSSGRNIGATTITVRGTVALRIDARAESIDCSPTVIRMNGSTTFTMLITRRWPYIRGLRGSSWRAMATTVARNSAPRVRRPAISVSGGRPPSRPILIHRYEEPQKKPRAMKTTQYQEALRCIAG